ncbi:MAG: PCMD domain-containing protein, partial [Bacteroidales bacterium]|nr:PCMD domain-containing protein [Bacteroidales bacterium]
MDFDHWSKSSGSWNPYPKGAGSNQLVWDTANRGLSVLGINGTVPEYDHVAVPGEGKAAAKIVSRKVVWAFVAGNLFTGRFI